MSHHEVVLLLGSNLGNPKSNIELAIKYIEEEISPIFDRSEILITDPVEFVSNKKFCNIAVLIKTQQSPINLLNLIKKIERKMGRVNDTVALEGYQDRIIDIDIVSFDHLIFSCEILNIPHYKHQNEREFSKKLLYQLSGT